MFDTCVDFCDTHLESFPDLLVLPPGIYQLQKKRVVKDFDSFKNTFIEYLMHICFINKCHSKTNDIVQLFV